MIYWDELMKDPKDAAPEGAKPEKRQKPEKSAERRSAGFGTILSSLPAGARWMVAAGSQIRRGKSGLPGQGAG